MTKRNNTRERTQKKEEEKNGLRRKDEEERTQKKWTRKKGHRKKDEKERDINSWNKAHLRKVWVGLGRSGWVGGVADVEGNKMMHG